MDDQWFDAWEIAFVILYRASLLPSISPLRVLWTGRIALIEELRAPFLPQCMLVLKPNCECLNDSIVHYFCTARGNKHPRTVLRQRVQIIQKREILKSSFGTFFFCRKCSDSRHLGRTKRGCEGTLSLVKAAEGKLHCHVAPLIFIPAHYL